MSMKKIFNIVRFFLSRKIRLSVSSDLNKEVTSKYYFFNSLYKNRRWTFCHYHNYFNKPPKINTFDSLG